MNRINKSTSTHSSSIHHQRANGHAIKTDLGEKMQETLNGVKTKASETQATVVSYVKKNPGKSLGIAVLAGVVMGVLLRR